MNFWGWFSQRVTGLLLVLLVAVHVHLAYFAEPGGAVTFNLVQTRSRSWIFVVDQLLLITGLYHGLYGLRQVLLDMVPQWKGKGFTTLFVVCGLGLCFLGVTTLVALR